MISRYMGPLRKVYCARTRAILRFNSLLFLSALSIALPSSCRKPAAQDEALAKEPYLSDPNSVGFDLSPLPGNNGTRRWLATYSDAGKTARFTLEIGPPTPMGSAVGGSLAVLSGQGAILSMPGSDASTMLAALQKALGASHLPTNVRRTSRLTFEYLILGEHDSQSPGGSFSATPPGNWTDMKIFLGTADNESIVYLNFNPINRKAQFSEKDPNYGDSVLAQLATVL